jgi:hypothetical protein
MVSFPSPHPLPWGEGFDPRWFAIFTLEYDLRTRLGRSRVCTPATRHSPLPLGSIHSHAIRAGLHSLTAIAI